VREIKRKDFLLWIVGILIISILFVGLAIALQTTVPILLGNTAEPNYNCAVQANGTFQSIEVLNEYDTYSNWDGSFAGTVREHVITLTSEITYLCNLVNGKDDTIYYTIIQILLPTGEGDSFDLYIAPLKSYWLSYVIAGQSVNISIIMIGEREQ
jgi:hypothetical protein